MRGNTFGKMLSMTTFGESHGDSMGVIIDGMPAGLSIDISELKEHLKRRAPGNLVATTSRKESDHPEILSGIMDNITLGTPICVVVKNTNQKSSDYDKLKDNYRPGHADQTTILKYGIRDHRGGGRSSGRETLARVIAGYFASLVVKNVKLKAFIKKLGPFEYSGEISADMKIGSYGMPVQINNSDIENYLLKLKNEGNSIGGIAHIVIENCPPGLGEPCFDKLKADLFKAIGSIGAVVSVSYGAGEDFATLTGKEITANRKNFSGIEGGISNGDPIILSAIVRPPSTVGEAAKEGRHDPCILPRVLPVLEAMTVFTIADHFLRQNAYQVGLNHD